jgi:hypothetical protein
MLNPDPNPHPEPECIPVLVPQLWFKLLSHFRKYPDHEHSKKTASPYQAFTTEHVQNKNFHKSVEDNFFNPRIRQHAYISAILFQYRSLSKTTALGLKIKHDIIIYCTVDSVSDICNCWFFSITAKKLNDRDKKKTSRNRKSQYCKYVVRNFTSNKKNEVINTSKFTSIFP